MIVEPSHARSVDQDTRDVVELSVVLGLRGLTISEYFAERDPVGGGVYVLLLAIFVVMPWLLGRRP